MNRGIQHEKANVPMLPSWIMQHPTGQESGEYLGLELSGATVRIYLVTLHGRGRITTRQQKYPIHDHLKRGPIYDLIDYLAISVDSFLSFIRHENTGQKLSLGFVLSFPLYQTAINKAYVMQWTKDFAVTGAQNKNLVDLLQTALRRRHIPVIVKAVCNGAVACLLAQSYRSLDTLLACTVSTGTNAAYWEKIDSIEKLDMKDKSTTEDGEMIINTEWGSFGDYNAHYLPRTFYDNRVNRESSNPGVHIFEKMVSGMYLGEIVRQIMVDFADRRLLFNCQCSEDLNTPYAFEAPYMSAIESDETQDLDDTKHILESVMNIPKTTIDDRRAVKRMCQLVGQRAARLIAAGISSIIIKQDALDGGLTISVEGNIYEHYPNFPNRVNEALRDLYGHKVDRINLGITRDGNGIGGAVAAMLANTQK